MGKAFERPRHMFKNFYAHLPLYGSDSISKATEYDHKIDNDGKSSVQTKLNRTNIWRKFRQFHDQVNTSVFNKVYKYNRT